MDEYKDDITQEPDKTKPYRIYNKDNQTDVKVDKNEHKKVGEGVELTNKTILVKKIKFQKINALNSKGRYSEKEAQCRKKVRVSEYVKPAILTCEDRAPVYSSFTDDKRFYYGPTQAVLQKIDEEVQE